MHGSDEGGQDARTDPSGDVPGRSAPMTLAPSRIESAALTHQGRVREKNQDSFCIRERDGLWAVADGMGGHEGGEWASARLVEKIGEIDVPEDIEEAPAAVEEAIRAAN